jgi:predicted permease
VLRDLVASLRALRKTPGFAVLAVLTLVFGIGANSTIFSWINSTLLNPIPGIGATSELICVARGGAAFADMPFSYPDYLDLRSHSRSVSGLTAFTLAPMNLTGIGKPQRVWGTLAAANYFDVLSLRALHGRVFLPAEDSRAGDAPVTVISFHLWQSHFGGSPSVIGRTVHINFHPYTVVGIAPPSFQGTQTGLRSDLWIPLVMANRVLTFKDGLDNRARAWLFLMARLKPGSEGAAVQAEMKVLMRQLVDQYPVDHRGQNVSPTAYPVWRSPYGGNRYLYVLLPTLMAASGLLLLLACANMANLLLVRGMARRRELAIQLALGSGRWRLVRRCLAESAILALVGGALAVLVTLWSSQLFSRFVPPSDVPIDFGLHFDRNVLFATLFLSLLATVAFGILPALRVTALSPQAVLKEEAASVSGGGSTSWISRGLVVLQIALSLVLMISTGLFVRSFENAQQFDPGFDRKDVLLATFDLSAEGYAEEDTIAFQRDLLSRLESVPGVESATLSNWTPLGPSAIFKTIGPEGYVPSPDESMVVGTSMVGPRYFTTMRIPLSLGREFTSQDATTAEPAAVVNQALADRYWRGQSALGKRIQVGSKAYSVVGVARNSNYHELNEAPQAFVYLATLQNFGPQQTLFVRVKGDPRAFSSAVEKTVDELDDDLVLFDTSTLEARVQFASATKRMAATFAGAFGFLALALASIGIYGVVTNTARQRTREIGIRMAIGATRGDIARLVLGDGLRLTLIGTGSGVLASLFLTSFLRKSLFGVAPTDALTYAVAVVLLSAVALTACYVPTRRAMGVEPILALRCR